MIKHKIIVIGAVGSGKSSLLSCLKGNGMNAKKTQALIFDSVTIDTPGEYMENPRMYSYIISAAQDVEYIIFIQDSKQKRCIYPPGFAQCFTGKTIGVITKLDSEEDSAEASKKILKTLGIKGPIFKTSSKTGYGIEELRKYLGLLND